MKQSDSKRGLVYLQTLVDVALIAGIVYYTGGVSSPFGWVFIIPIVAIGVLVGRTPCITAALMSSIAYALVVFAQAFDAGAAAVIRPGLPLWGMAGTTAVSHANLFFIVGLSSVIVERLRLSERKYRDLVESAADVIYSHDLDGNLLSANKAAFKLTGYTRDDLPIKLSGLLSPRALKIAREEIKRQLRGEPPGAPQRLDVVTKEGAVRTLELNTRLVADGGTAIEI